MDIKIVDEIEQEQLLIRAALTSKFDNSALEKNRALFEEDGKIFPEKIKEFLDRNGKHIGYCRSFECRNNYKNKIIHSANFGNFAPYYCQKCLAKLICLSRKNSRGCFVLIVFDISNNGEINVTKNNRELFVDIGENYIYIDGVRVDYVWENVTPEDNVEGDFLPKKLRVKTKVPIYISGQLGYLDGVYKGIIKGRHICKNHLLGNYCASKDPTYVPDNFVAKTLPPGVTSWYVSHRLETKGNIMINEYCCACYELYLSPKKDMKWKGIENKKEILKLQEVCSDLLIKNNELQEEVASLRLQIVKLKADNLRKELKLN